MKSGRLERLYDDLGELVIGTAKEDIEFGTIVTYDDDGKIVPYTAGNEKSPEGVVIRREGKDKGDKIVAGEELAICTAGQVTVRCDASLNRYNRVYYSHSGGGYFCDSTGVAGNTDTLIEVRGCRFDRSENSLSEYEDSAGNTFNSIVLKYIPISI